MTIEELQRLKPQANILVGRQENISAADKEETPKATPEVKWFSGL